MAAKAKTQDERIEAMVGEPTTAASIVKDAMKEHKTQQDDKRKREIIGELSAIDSHIDNSVAQLREARKIEKASKAHTAALDNAKQAYMENPDWQVFCNSKSEADRACGNVISNTRFY